MHRENQIAQKIVDRATELAAGQIGEMPMRHQGFVELQWPGFEHEIHGRTESSDSFQSEFGQLTGLKGRQG